MGCGSTPFHLLVLLQLIITNPKATPRARLDRGAGNPHPRETLNPEEPSTQGLTTSRGSRTKATKRATLHKGLHLKLASTEGNPQPGGRQPSTQRNPQPRGLLQARVLPTKAAKRTTLHKGLHLKLASTEGKLNPGNLQPRGTLNPGEPSTQGNPQPRGTFNPGEPSPLQPRGTFNPGEPSSPQPRGTFIPGESSPPQRRKSGPESSKTCREPRGPEKCLEHPFW